MLERESEAWNGQFQIWKKHAMDSAPADRARDTDETPVEFRDWEDLGSRLDTRSMIDAFGFLPGVYLFVKDRQRRFVHFTPNFPALMGLTERELIGKRDEDLSPEFLAEHYRKGDIAVLERGTVIADVAELVHNQRGSYDWNITSKWPLRSRTGEIVALGGVTRRLRDREQFEDHYLKLTPALDLMIANLSRNIALAELAAAVALSPSQFGRVFRARFGVTPQQYQRRLRLDAACDLLATTSLPIAEVASRCGYYDQSHLTNAFRTSKGMTPTAYRLRFAVDRR